MGILLFVLKYMFISLLLNGFSWPAEIMASPFNTWPVNWLTKKLDTPLYKFAIRIVQDESKKLQLGCHFVRSWTIFETYKLIWVLYK